jgi:hypothetical protein
MKPWISTRGELDFWTFRHYFRPAFGAFLSASVRAKLRVRGLAGTHKWLTFSNQRLGVRIRAPLHGVSKVGFFQNYSIRARTRETGAAVFRHHEKKNSGAIPS